MAKKENNKNEKTLFETVISDLRSGDFGHAIFNDLTDLREFYLDESRQKAIEEMGRVRGAIFTVFRIIKSLIFKLNPARRIILLLSFFLMISGLKLTLDARSHTVLNLDFAAYFVALFLLLLEMKDKLLAKNELEIGRTVQSALMPNSMPGIPGWKIWLYTAPAKEVGGDLVDFLQITDKKFAVSVADVSGKGLGAALLMTKLQATIRALAPDAESPSELGEKVNRIFKRDTMPQSFASLLYAEINASRNEVKFLNAGHLPPVIISSGEVTRTAQTSPAVGLMMSAKFAEQSVELKDGDKFFVFSDGLTEARAVDGEFFGEERLMHFVKLYSELGGREFGEKILETAERFTENAGAHDDLSIAVIEKIPADQ